MVDKRVDIELNARDKSKPAFDAVKRNFGDVERSIKSIRGLMVGAFAAIGVTTLARFVRSSLSAADSIDKMASRVGVSTAALQELRYAASQAGVAQNQLDIGLQRFSRRIAEAAKGNKTYNETLTALGVTIRDGNGQLRRNEDILGDVAEGLSKVQSEAERTRLTFTLFDSEGVAMVNMLKDGRAALEGMRQKARELGLVLDDELIKNAVKANDDLDTLEKVLSIKLTAAIAKAAPAISWLADAIGWLITPFDDPQAKTPLQAAADEVERLRKEAEGLRAAKGGEGDGTTEFFRNKWKAEIEDARAKAEGNLKSAQSAMELLKYGKMPGPWSVGVGVVKPEERARWNPEELAARERAATRQAEIIEELTKAQEAASKRAADKAVEDEKKKLEKMAELRAEHNARMFKADIEARKKSAAAAFKIANDEYEREREIRSKRRDRQIEESREVWEKQKRAAEEVRDAWGAAFDNMGRTMIQVLTDSTKSTSDKMKAILLTMIYEVGNAMIRTWSQQPGAGSGAGSIFGNIGQSIVSWLMGSGGASPTSGSAGANIGAALSTLHSRAGGGSTAAGHSYLVGERGPELFRSATSGHIIANENMPMAGGIRGPRLSVNLNVYPGVPEAVRREMLAYTPGLTKAIKNAVAQDIDENKAVGKRVRGQ